MRWKLSVLCAALVIAGCGGEGDKTRALAGTAEVMQAGYQQLASASDRLLSQSDALCREPNENSLAAARTAYSDAMAAWMRIQPVRFGPIREDNRDYRLQFWPDPRDLVASETDKLVGRDEDVDAEKIAGASVAVQGLPAIEYLLYPDDLDPLAAFRGLPGRCPVLRAIAENTRQTAAQLADAWSGGETGGRYARRLTEFGPEEGRFANPDAALSVVVGSLVESVQHINTAKLGWPMGSRADGQPQPLQVESRRSGLSVENIRNNLAGMQQVFTAGQAYGLHDYLRGLEGGEALAEDILEQFMQAQKQAASIKRPLFVALKDGEQLAAYRTLLNSTRALESLLSERLAPLLGVKPGFNFNDGD